MYNLKIFFLLLLLTGIHSNNIFAQYFTYYGPTEVTIVFGQNSAQGTFYFDYYNMPPEAVMPRLAMILDGELLAGGICSGGNEDYLPSSYTFTFTSGVHSVEFALCSLGEYEPCGASAITWQDAETQVTCKFTIRVENKDFTGGKVYVDNYITQKNAPYNRPCTTGNVFSIGAIDQPSGGYNWIWNNSGTNNSQWIRKLISGAEYFHSYDRNTTYTTQSTDKNTRLLAGLKKLLANVVFQNNFIGVGNGGVIKVNNVQFNSPKTADPVVELNPVTSQALSQVVNGIQYTFTQWNDGNTSAYRTFYPATNTTYTANYAGKPLSFSIMNTHFNDIPGQNVIIYWNDHPNTNVTQYQIWRKVKHNGVTGPPALLATRNRGTTSYTDYDYEITSGYTNDLVYYDVRPYYTTESTYADAYWLPIFGEPLPKTSDSTDVSENIPDEFSISCYPNPFNPTTNILVTMPADGLLKVVIYNVLGEEIIQLKNEMITKGSYNFTWGGKDSGFNQVNSGIYIVLVNTVDKMISQKIVLLK